MDGGRRRWKEAHEDVGGLGELGRKPGDEGNWVDGILNQVDESKRWEMKETGRGLLGMEKIQNRG